METYVNTEVVEAMEVKYLQGNIVCDSKKPSKKGSVTLPDNFINRNVIRLGDFITFKNGAPVAVMSPADFAASYEQAANVPVDPEPPAE